MEHKISNSFLTVTIAERGAEIQSITAADGTEFFWDANKDIWPKHGPNLFPYLSSLTDGKYTLDGKTYEMGLHGFVPYTDLVAGENFGNSISFALKANEETLKCYPFQFTYRVTYTLEESKLFVTYTVENHDSKTMYFGIGGHPGFHMPIDGTLAFEDYRLTFEKPCTASRITIGGQKGGVTGEVAYPIETGCMELKHDLFDNGPIVLKNSGHSIVISSDKSPKTIKVSYPDMPYVGPARTEAYSVGHLAGVGSAAHNKGCKAGLQCLIDQRGQPLYHRPLGVRKNAATIVDSLFHAQTVYL